MKYSIKVPDSLNQAVEFINHENTACLAGGTNLLVSAHKGAKMPETLVDITGLEELGKVIVEGDFLKIGSLATFAEIEANKFIKQNFLCLHKAAAEVGGPQIRNTATIGGNICNASPAADSSAALMALEAEVELKSIEGTRRMAIADIFVHVGMTSKKQNEILTYIYIPLNKIGSSDFCKVGKRNALAISILNMAVAAKLVDNKLAEITIAVGAAAPTIVRARKTEEFLLGKTVSAEVVEAAKEMIIAEISPIDDLRATADYRKKLCANVLSQLLENIGGIEHGA